MPRHHIQHTRNVGPNLFAHNESIAYIMPHSTTCAVMSYVHCAACHTGEPATLCICGMPGITYGCAVRAGRTIFMKINRLTF